jgi:hypothetical protein
MPSKRYLLLCVAPEVQSMETNDLEEALKFVNGSYYGSHFDIYDTVDKKYIDPVL